MTTFLHVRMRAALFFAVLSVMWIAGGCEETNLPNPDDAAPVLQSYRANTEWRVVADEPFQCGQRSDANGCRYMNGESCTIFAADPFQHPPGERREKLLAVIGFEYAKCAKQEGD